MTTAKVSLAIHPGDHIADEREPCTPRATSTCALGWTRLIAVRTRPGP